MQLWQKKKGRSTLGVLVKVLRVSCLARITPRISSLVVVPGAGTTRTSSNIQPPRSPLFLLDRKYVTAATTARLGASRQDNDDENDKDVVAESLLSDQDWLAFRAKLVLGAPTRNNSGTAADDDTTAASVTPTARSDSSNSEDWDGIGTLFNAAAEDPATSPSLSPLDPSQWAYDSGTVIEMGAVLLRGVEQDFGFGLRQQYFHKAAILVLDHEESTFTKGIILNRPTDLTLEDDINKGVKWRVWFGGVSILLFVPAIY